MKKAITTLSLIFLLGTLTASAQCCGNQATNNCQSKSAEEKSNATTTIKAYYFHATRRCATCNAVEEVTKQALKEFLEASP